MQQEFEKYLNDYCLHKSDRKILLAVSGGIDSMLMLHFFMQVQNLEYSVAHCNFKLRGKDSDSDEKFVKEYCVGNQIPFYSRSFNTEQFAAENNVSIQMAARELRYNWFNQLLHEYNYNVIATAHHKSDVVETILINLTRGTGIAGLHGITPRKNKIIRPLLFCNREEIEAYAKQINLVWREDASNKKNNYARNKIRNKIIPLLKEINPSLEETFISNAKHILDAEVLLKQYTADIEMRVCKKEDSIIFIKIDKLVKIDNHKQFLSFYLSGFGFNQTVIHNILQNLYTQSGKRFYSSEYQLLIDRNQLIISKPQQWIKSCAIAQPDEATVHCDYFDIELFQNEISNNEVLVSKGSQTAMLDLEKLVFPLRIRPWEPGDVFKPLGMKGRKKVSDFLIDEKVNRNEKDLAMVLTSGNKIAWLIGYRIDDDFKIGDNTKKYLELKLKVNS